MSLTGIGNNNAADIYTAGSAAEVDKNTAASTAKPESSKTDTTAKKEDAAVVYDKSKLSDDDRKAIVAQLKADQEKRQSQLTDLVHNMLNTQTNTFGQANNIWQFLAKGNFTVDAETKKKAQEAISEDGYWGVKQTSDRILSFATALAGDDKAQLEKMRDAFLKGYEKAEKTWGGKLPDISKRTYDAVLEKFDSLINPKTTDKDMSVDKTDSTASNKNNTITTTEDGTVISK